ncbi:MAG: hydrogenase maturation nickel metallochaperone HypA [Candidatus Komeilibacteria bacterium]|nr:hydrogenase maturation nickel metallochaperone HypA [Candidatus Komeilibacteria bacterium]
MAYCPQCGGYNFDAESGCSDCEYRGDSDPMIDKAKVRSQEPQVSKVVREEDKLAEKRDSKKRLSFCGVCGREFETQGLGLICPQCKAKDQPTDNKGWLERKK